MMQKGFAPILVLVGVLIIAFIAGGAYYLGRSSTKSQTPVVTTTTPATGSMPTDETVSWKTYTDTDYLFKIGYPTGWAIKTGQSNYISSLEGKKFLVKDFSLEDKEGETYINIRGNFQGGFCEGVGCKEEEYTNKSGIRIKKFTAASAIYYTFSLKGNNFFVIAGPVDQSTLLDKIMSSLKLTN